MIRLVLACLSAAVTLGRVVGLVLHAVLPLRRRIVTVQMRTALGTENVRPLAIKVFMNQGVILVDTVRYAYLSDRELRRRIAIEGKEHLDRAVSSGRGIMMTTGHIGNWEILSHLPRLLPIRFCVMADVRKDARLESIIDGIRSRSGATILPPKGKALMLIKELRKGNTIGMVIDQRGRRRDGLFCEVFGMPAPTNPPRRLSPSRARHWSCPSMPSGKARDTAYGSKNPLMPVPSARGRRPSVISVSSCRHGPHQWSGSTLTSGSGSTAGGSGDRP
jgi:lauroyl/myristoyl acyltransferase